MTDDELARDVVLKMCSDAICTFVNEESCGCFQEVVNHLRAIRAEATRAEREACAKVADAMAGWMQPRDVAAAIRARTATQAEEDDVTPEAISQLRSEAEPFLAGKTWTNAAPQPPASPSHEFAELRKSAEKAMGGTIADRSSFRPRPTHVFDLLEAYDAAVAALASRSQEGGMREALIDTTANLAAAVSAYEKFVGRHNKRGSRDALFETRYKDFEAALVRARAALAHDGGRGMEEG